MRATLCGLYVVVAEADMTRLQRATDTVKELACWYSIMLVVASTIYAYAEGTTFADAFYWAATTATSTGYGDLSPKTTIGRIDAIVLMHLSIFVIAPMVIVRLIDALTVNPHAFTHEEQTQLLADIAAMRAKLDAQP
jgi:voltage-gated potassium channel